MVVAIIRLRIHIFFLLQHVASFHICIDSCTPVCKHQPRCQHHCKDVPSLGWGSSQWCQPQNHPVYDIVVVFVVVYNVYIMCIIKKRYMIPVEVPWWERWWGRRMGRGWWSKPLSHKTENYQDNSTDYPHFIIIVNRLIVINISLSKSKIIPPAFLWQGL